MLWVIEAARSPIAWQRKFIKLNVAAACSVCFLICNGMCHANSARDVALHESRRSPKGIKSDDPYSIRRVDPTCRLRGFQTLGNEIDKVRHEIVGQGLADPVLAGLSWNMPGEIGFYCDGHPKTYSLGCTFAGEHAINRLRFVGYFESCRRHAEFPGPDICRS